MVTVPVCNRRVVFLASSFGNKEREKQQQQKITLKSCRLQAAQIQCLTAVQFEKEKEKKRSTHTTAIMKKHKQIAEEIKTYEARHPQMEQHRKRVMGKCFGLDMKCLVLLIQTHKRL